MRRRLTLVLAFAALACGASLLSACNTAQGFGQDMQAGGRAVERSVDRNR
jgi:predicted small secreted protein